MYIIIIIVIIIYFAVGIVIVIDFNFSADLRNLLLQKCAKDLCKIIHPPCAF